jgi:hypothetical protein
MLLSNSDGFIPSVKPFVIVFSKFVFKKLFRIYNIKLFKFYPGLLGPGMTIYKNMNSGLIHIPGGKL